MEDDRKPAEATEHGEPGVKPRFGPDKPRFGGGENTSGGEATRNPMLEAIQAASPAAYDPVNIRNKERNAAGAEKSENGSSEKSEKSSLGMDEGTERKRPKTIPYSKEEKSNRFIRFRGHFTRRKTMALAVTAVVGTGGVGLFGVIQGPLQFVHFAQNLRNFHLKTNEDFGNDRASKVLLYSLAGLGAERGKLGVTGNYFADKWENRLVRETGLRPVYNNQSGRFAGFEIVDGEKARNTINEWWKDGNGNAVTRIDKAGGQGVRGSGKYGEVNQKGSFIDARKLNSNEKRKLLTNVSKSTGTNNIVGPLATRLLKKRGGVDFAPLKNKVRDRADNRLDKREDKKKEKQRILKESAQRDKLGVEPAKRAAVKSIGEDTEGNLTNDPLGDQVADDADEVIKEANEKLSSPGDDTVKSVKTGIVRAAGATAVVGVLCSAKSFGSDIPKYKQEHIAMPVMRMGFKAISMGEQIKSGENVDLDELEAFNDLLYDEETGTSWTSAKSIQAEMGQKQTGPDIPKEAQLTNINDKPFIFDALDKIPFLDQTCSVSDSIFGLPGIKQVSGLVSDITISGVDAVLGVAGTSVEELMTQALAVASGNSVNLFAKGAERGNLANLGAFMAGNDTALAMGGDALNRRQVAELKTEEHYFDTYNTSQKSFFARYFDPYESNALIGAAINRAPKSPTSVAINLTNPLKNTGSLLSALTPKSFAASSGNYNYGVPKYGYSIEERDDPRFEDPYENAVIVEKHLNELNEKYSPCFSMKILNDDEGVHLESGESVNVFTLPENGGKGNCQKPDKNSPDYELYLRFRFYIADSVAAITLACNEGREEACEELSANPETSIPQSAAGEGQDADLDLLASDTDHIPCYQGTKDLGVVQTLFTLESVIPSGKAPKVRLCQIPSIPGQGNNTQGQEISGGAVVISPISKAWYTLGKDAQAAGIALQANSSFRLAHSCGGTGDGSACARPGKSAHQSGLAIDFGNGMYGFKGTSTTSCGGRIRLPNNPAWSWLNENAENYGLYQYTYEAWHWDPLYVLDNRCNSSGTAKKGGTLALNTNGTGDSETPAANDAKTLAKEILNNPNVTYPYRDTRGLTARDVLEDVARTGKGPINSPDTTARSVTVSPNMLKAILEYAQNNKIGLNPITNADHSSYSNHYKGLAVDINCTPALNRAEFDRIAAKYGGRNNGEVCPGNSHWHYDFLGAAAN